MLAKEIIKSEKEDSKKEKPSFETLWKSVEVELSPIIIKLFLEGEYFLEGAYKDECSEAIAEAIINAYEAASKKFESPQISFIGPDGRFQKSVDIATTQLSATHLNSHFVRFLHQLKISDAELEQIYLNRKARNKGDYYELDDNIKETGLKKLRKYLVPIIIKEIQLEPIVIINTFIKLLKSFNPGTGIEIIGSKGFQDELSDLSIIGLDFEGVTISDKTITSVDLNNSNLQKLSFKNNITNRISFRKSNLEGSTLLSSEFNEPKFTETNLTLVNISYCKFNTPNFSGAKLSDVMVDDSQFTNLNLKENEIKVENNRPISFNRCVFTGGSLMSKVFEREPDYINAPLKASNSANMANQDSSLANVPTEWAIFDNCEFTDVNFGTDDSRFKFNGCTFTNCKKNGVLFDPNQVTS